MKRAHDKAMAYGPLARRGQSVCSKPLSHPRAHDRGFADTTPPLSLIFQSEPPSRCSQQVGRQRFVETQKAQQGVARHEETHRETLP